MASTTKLLRGLLLAAAAAAGVTLLLRRSRPGAPHPVEGRFVVNAASGVFHVTGCRTFAATASSPAFTARDDALAAGYRPCGVCKP